MTRPERDRTEFRHVATTSIADYARVSSGQNGNYHAKCRDGPNPFCVLQSITPDKRNGLWLNQTDETFQQLLPLANRETKLAKTTADEQAVFGLFANSAKTNRDEWVYDFDVANLRAKALFFADTYNGLLDSGDKSHDPVIKWSHDLRNEFRRGKRIVYNDGNRIQSLYRPFVVKHHFADFTMNDRLTGNHYEMFGPDLRQTNKVINLCVNGKAFYVLATDKLPDYHFIGDTQCLPLYRYTADGERVSNITAWGLRQFREHYGDDRIDAADVFAYVYAMLHDPAYRQRYERDLRREFPRVYFQKDFHWWAGKGRQLLELHLGFASAEPWPLARVDQARTGRAGSRGRPVALGAGGPPSRAILRADQERHRIILDDQTTLAGVPPAAWHYQLGSRSALEWALDQYKEKRPRDPTIRERFNAYRFADYKERVIDLLARVCAVSVATVGVVGELDLRTEIDPDAGLEFTAECATSILEA